MNSLEILGRVVAVLDATGVEHMLVGAFSAIAYGLARATKDADFVVACEPETVTRIAAALGSDFRLDRQIEFETLTGSRRNVITHVPSGFAVELFYLGDDPHHRERFARRQRGMVGRLARGVWLPTAEDVVIQKIRWGRDKDIVDVRNVIAVCDATLDWAYIRRWTDEHGTSARLETLRQEAAAGSSGEPRGTDG